MSSAITVILLLFAAMSFAGAGVALAIARSRELEEVGTDLGMRTVATLLAVFGATCSILSAGLSSVLAFGAVIGWAAYVLTAQRIGVFEIIQPNPPFEDTVAGRPF